MAQGFDKLLNFLLDEIALCFTEGATVNGFKDKICHFYSTSKLSNATDASNIDQNLEHVVDQSLLAKAWIWLVAHPDIWVGKSSSDDALQPEIIIAGDQSAINLSLAQAEALNAASDDETKHIRLWTSHERVWQTVAGHGVDFKRIPGEEFRLLCLIAKAGEKGIVQPDLVKSSQQDKKSVPGRTDNLNRAGYIRKTRILVEKHNTSLLVHRRFLPKEELDILDRPIFVNGTLSFENLLNLLVEKLKNGATMAMDDLEDELKCGPNSWEKRALWRALERLDIIGVLQRFRLDEQKPGRSGKLRIFKTRTLKLLREPTEADYKRFTSLSVKDREDFRRRLEAQDAETQGEHAEYMDDEDYAPAENTDAGAVNDAKSTPIVHRMQWDSDVAWTTTVFNAVRNAGPGGLSSMAAREATYGRFYDRPVEQMLGRLTDVWQKAQPAQLIHFNIIRDTDTKGRSTNYQYRTHDFFQQAVDGGNTVWENATGGKPYQKPVPKLDKFGFSVPDTTQFLKKGTATLSESVAETGFQIERLQRSDPLIKENADGTLEIVWNNDIKKKPRQPRVKALALDGVDDELPKTPKSRGGRPPKGSGTSRRKQTAEESSAAAARGQKKTEVEQRLQAERQAYEEALKVQKATPATTFKGKQIVALFKPGQGRSKMILVNENGSDEVTDIATAFKVTKKAPVVVLESAVLRFLQIIKEADESVGSGTASDKPPAKQRIVCLKSSRLAELSWFKAADKTINEVEAAPKSMQIDVPEGEERTDSARATSPAGTQGIDKAAPLSPTSLPPHETPLPHPTATKDFIENGSAPLMPESSTEIANEIATPEELETHKRKDWAQRQSNYVRPPPASGSNRKKKGTVVGRGTAQYKRILLIEQIMEKSGGIFPGDSEMVPAFQRLQKTELKSETTADRDTVMKAVKALVDSGKIKRFAFFFKDQNGKKIQKFVIHDQTIDPACQEIKDLMEKIEAAYPRNFVPPPYGDGEVGRAEQRKNIDRFQYRPGKSVVKPSGTEFVIDIEAKRKELEAKREAAAAAIRAEEKKRLKEQAARNKQRQATIARKPRHNRPILQKPAHIDPWSLDHMPDDDPDKVMPSIEMDGMPITYQASRPRHRGMRAGGPLSELNLAKLDSGMVVDMQARRPSRPLLTLPGGQVLLPPTDDQDTERHRPKIDSASFRSWGASVRRRRQTLVKQPVLQHSKFQSKFMFKEPLTPRYYDLFYDIQDISTLLKPLQRFHPNTGTFSTDFFVRTDVRQSLWMQPQVLRFEHRSLTKTDDVEYFKSLDDYDNFYHPDRKPRQFAPGLLSKKREQQEAEQDLESDVELEDAWFEKKELQIMKQEYPDLLQEKHVDGFANYLFGGVQTTADVLYNYGVRPMEQIVIHGVDREDYPDIEFDDRTHRPGMTIEETEEEGSDDAEEVPTPRATRTPKRAKRARRATLEEAPSALPAPPSKSADARSGTQSGTCHISSADSRRLFFACIATRVLNSTFEGTIEWRTIADIFAGHLNYDLPTFKARWNRMYHNYPEIVTRVEVEFQDAFSAAYGKGLLPTIDVQHGNRVYFKRSSDWVRVVDWAVKTIPVFPDEVGLPATRSDLSQSLMFRVESQNDQEEREKFEHAYATHAKREEVAHSAAFALPLRGKKRAPIQNVDVAKSWIRANCATSPEHYNAEKANAKLQKLDQGLLVAMTKELHTDKTIAHSFKLRNKIARNYHLSDQYRFIFDKRQLDNSNFAEALAFKAQLDEAFTNDDPCMVLESHITEGGIMVLTELIAAGRVATTQKLPPIDSTIGAPWPRLTIWGFTEGQYKMRNMDRKTFTYALKVVPTTRYVTGIPTLEKLERIEPPRRPKQDQTEHARIPLWYDIHDNFVLKWWEALLRSVVQHIAMKTGLTIAMLAAPYRGLVWEWEIRLLVEWLMEVGVAEMDKHGSIRAKEWWWSVVPRRVADEEKDAAGAAAKGAETLTADPETPTFKRRRVRKEKL